MQLWIAEAAAVFGDCDDGAATTYPGAWDGPKVPLQPAGLNAPGFLAEFFALPPGATMPPELSMLTKLLSRQDVVVELFPGYASVGPTLPRDIAARWTGTLRIPVAGAYSFEVESDDGFRLYVGDGAPLHDEWTATSGLTRNDPKQLEVNTAIPIRLEWFDLRQVAKIRLWWSGPGFAKRRLTVALDATPSQATASCDSVDNDCDGQKDEDVFSLPAVGGVVPDLRLACSNVCQPFDAPIYQHGKACGTGPGPEHLGACHPGFTYCRPNGTWSDCADDAPIAAAGPEVCGNFEDDDCDGQVNEDCP